MRSALVTPNWQCQLPGHPYDGDDPDGFMVRDEITAYLDRFLASFEPPLIEGVAVQRVRREEPGGPFTVDTSAGTLTADQVIIATGATTCRCAAARSFAAGVGDAGAFAAVPQRRRAAGWRGARRRLRPVGCADRRGSAPGGASGAPRGR